MAVVESIDGFIVFSDLKGFSKLSLEEQERYLVVHVNLLSKTIKPLWDKAFVSNTWGDAVIAVFKDGEDAAEFMLNYRQEAKNIMRTVAFDKKVLPRIAGHYGNVNIFKDPLLERDNTISNEVNTAARIEPVTRPGEIFVSKEFKEAFVHQQRVNDTVKFERLGKLPLTKGHGEWELFRLIRWDESTHIIDKLLEMDLPKALPIESELGEAEEQLVEEIKKITDREQILTCLKKEWNVDHTGEFAVKMAEVCKRAGLYQEGLDWITRAQKVCVLTSGIPLYPYRTKNTVIKLKADLLTRLDLYDESGEILYSLWRNIEGQNTKDASEILAMLAAQFKRRALIRDNQIVSKKEVNEELLKKAAGLYLEAFRHNFDNYYPAINAAYLLVIIGKVEARNGKKLAQYIIDTWKNERESSYWLDITLAEAELVQGFYDEALEKMQQAFIKHKHILSIFDIEATKLQIQQFLTLMDEEEEGQMVIDLLNQHLEKRK